MHDMLARCSRRDALSGAGLLAGGAMLSGGAFAAVEPRAGWTPGLQLYTLGDAPAKDLDGTLRQVADIGYREVELASDYGRPPAELRRAFDAAGLVCPAIHVVLQPTPGMWDLAGDVDRVAADVRALGARTAVVSIALLPERIYQALHHPPAGGHDQAALTRLLGTLTADDWKHTADALNDRAARLARAGVALAYHNHGFEFAALPGGGSGFDLLVAHTDPRRVNFELDIGWALSAGRDLDALFAQAGKRITMMHLKDLKRGSAQVMELAPADVGTGIVPWQRLADLVRRYRVRHLFVEQEPPFPGPPIDSVRVAYAYLSGLFGASTTGAKP